MGWVDASPSMTASPSSLPTNSGSDAALVFWTAVYALAAVATLAVVVYGAIAALRQLGETVKTRHLALMADLSRRWDAPLLVESRVVSTRYDQDRERFRRRIEFLYEEQTEELFVLERIPNFFEDLGVLEDQGAISEEMVWMSLGRTICETWDRWEPAVSFLREKFADARVYENFEALARRMQTYGDELDKA